MKKLLAIFAIVALAFLASCGNKAEQPVDADKNGTKKEVTEPVKNDTKAASGNACETLIAYTECTSKKSGIDDDTVKATITQMKEGFKAAGDSATATCEASLEQMKKAPKVEGCSL